MSIAKPYNVLFLCTGNSARSIIAEAIMNREGRGRFKAFSAGSHPKGVVNPHAIALLKRLDYQTNVFRSKGWDEFAVVGAPPLDFVITVCDSAAGEVCPIWPGQPMTAHWGMPDPAAVEGTKVEITLLRGNIPHAQQSYQRLRKSEAIGSRQAVIAEPGMRYRPARKQRLGMPDASLEPPLQSYGLVRRLVAEGLGTALLLAIVIGSGIMGERLAGGNAAIALLANTIATGAGLVVLITIFGPLSGAHFNPVVSLMFASRRELSWSDAAAYVAVQIVGAIVGVFLAHAMFGEPLLQISTKLRSGWSQELSEAVATFGLVATIMGSLRFRAVATPFLVGLYIVAAYWFTASTSFANPVVTIARSLSNTFAGIAPASVPLFILGQCAGAAVATCLFRWLLKAHAMEGNR